MPVIPSYVLFDAYEWQNSRCLSVERAIATEMPEKIVILILNKIDLVPKEVLEKVCFDFLLFSQFNLFFLSPFL